MRKLKSNKKSMAIYLVLLAAVLTVMAGIRTCDTRNVYPHQHTGGSEGDTLHIALLYSPLSYYMYADTLGGYCYDALRMASAKAGVPVKLWPVVSLEEALYKLEKGDFDVVAPLPADNSLCGRFDYTQPLYPDRQILIQLRDKSTNRCRISSILDLAKDTIHIAKGSPAAYRIHKLVKEIGSPIHIVEHDNLSDEYLVTKVGTGQLKYAVVAERVASSMHVDFPDVDFSTSISFTMFQGGAVRHADTVSMNKFRQLLQPIQTDTLLRRRYGL